MMMMRVFLMASSCRYHGMSNDDWGLSSADDWTAFSGSFDAIAAYYTWQNQHKYEITSASASAILDDALLIMMRQNRCFRDGDWWNVSESDD